VECHIATEYDSLTLERHCSVVEVIVAQRTAVCREPGASGGNWTPCWKIMKKISLLTIPSLQKEMKMSEDSITLCRTTGKKPLYCSSSTQPGKRTNVRQSEVLGSSARLLVFLSLLDCHPLYRWSNLSVRFTMAICDGLWY
jgi:hypothetical protein